MKKFTNITRSIVMLWVIVLSGCMAEPQIENRDSGDSASPTLTEYEISNN